MKQPRPPSRIGRKRRVLGWTLLTLCVLVAGVWVWSGWRFPRQWVGPVRIGCLQGTVMVSAAFDHRSTVVPAMEKYDEARAENLRGRIQMYMETQRARTGKFPSWERPLFEWWNWQWVRTESSYAFTLPAWVVTLGSSAPAALLLRSGILARRRAMSNACPKCGYSLAGLSADAKCPECGKTTSEPQENAD